MTEHRCALPDRLEQFRGRINDIDSHESMPINHWREEYGSVVDKFVDALNTTSFVIKNVKTQDDAEINAFNVWNLKVEQAPGA